MWIIWLDAGHDGQVFFFQKATEAHLGTQLKSRAIYMTLFLRLENMS